MVDLGGKALTQVPEQGGKQIRYERGDRSRPVDPEMMTFWQLRRYLGFIDVPDLERMIRSLELPTPAEGVQSPHWVGALWRRSEIDAALDRATRAKTKRAANPHPQAIRRQNGNKRS